jgi:hypothetical protein
MGIQYKTAPHKAEITGIVVEFTYNWNWPVDALMKEGYSVHLANPGSLLFFAESGRQKL